MILLFNKVTVQQWWRWEEAASLRSTLICLSESTSIFPPLTTWTLKKNSPRTKWSRVSQTGSSRLFPWFPQWKEQGGEGPRQGREEEKWACHVTVTLRSCDSFGRVVINPQEVMMALSPEERLTHAHEYTGWAASRGRPHNVTHRLRDPFCVLVVRNLSNQRSRPCLLKREHYSQSLGFLFWFFFYWVPLVKEFRSAAFAYSPQLNGRFACEAISVC